MTGDVRMAVLIIQIAEHRRPQSWGQNNNHGRVEDRFLSMGLQTTPLIDNV